MGDEFFEKPVPKAFLLAAGALVCFSLLASFTSSMTDIGTTELVVTESVQTLDVYFQDRDDGSLAVLAATSGEEIDVLEPGTGGFVRGVLRGIGRQRKLRDLGPDLPYRLIRWSGGGLSLADPETDVRVDLEPFGPTNVQAFASIFRAGTANLDLNPQLSMQQE